MLGALNDTPFVDKNKIVIDSFPLKKENLYNIILPNAPYFAGDWMIIY
jgi:hypothetical protein